VIFNFSHKKHRIILNTSKITRDYSELFLNSYKYYLLTKKTGSKNNNQDKEIANEKQ
jgi:hypothetical protein